METPLRDTAKLAAEQQANLMLGPIRTAVEIGEGETGDHVLDDQNILMHAPQWVA